jgi:hypothetical protein
MHSHSLAFKKPSSVGYEPGKPKTMRKDQPPPTIGWELMALSWPKIKNGLVMDEYCIPGEAAKHHEYFKSIESQH